MDEQLIVAVLALALVVSLAVLVGIAASRSDATKRAKDKTDADARTIAGLLASVQESNVVLRGIASEAMEKFWAYDPNAREMARIGLESKALELQLSDTRARYRNGTAPKQPAPAPVGTKSAERFSDTPSDPL